MMHRIRLFLIASIAGVIGILLDLFALAAPPMLPLLQAGGGAGGGGTYTGPGNVAPGAVAWYGLRAYNAAYATGTKNAINIRRASDSTTTDVLILSSGALDTTSATVFCAATTCFVTKAYDQSGALACGGIACDAMQATAAWQPQLIFNCQNTTLPCMRFVTASTQFLESPTLTTLAQPFTVSYAAKRTGSFTSYNAILQSNGPAVWVGLGPAANQAFVFAGSTGTATATDSAAHAIQSVVNGSSSSINVDGTTTSGLAAGSSSGSSHPVDIGGASGGYFQGDFYEGGLWSGSISSLCNNIFTYWATATSC